MRSWLRFLFVETLECINQRCRFRHAVYVAPEYIVRMASLGIMSVCWNSDSDTKPIATAAQSELLSTAKCYIYFVSIALLVVPQQQAKCLKQNWHSTIPRQTHWADVDETWHVYYMGLMTKPWWTRILNFGPDSVRGQLELSQVGRDDRGLLVLDIWTG